MINWQEVPFVRLLMPFMVGLLGAAFEFPHKLTPDSILIALVLSLAAFFWMSSRALAYRFRQISGWTLLVLLYFLGQAVWQVQTPAYQQQHYKNLSETEATFLFRINEIKPSRSGKSQQLKITILGFETQPGVLQRVKGQSFCYLPADIKLQAGTCLLAKGQFQTLAAPSHPGSFDFAAYMQTQGILQQLNIQRGTILRLAADPFPSFRNRLRRLSTDLQQRLTDLLPAPSAGLLTALVLGQKNQLDADIRADYTKVGAMHVLAVSGMHVGIIAMGLSYLLAFWKGGSTLIRLTKGLVAVTGIWIFALLTGAAPSVLRAATMFSLFSLGKHLYFNQNIWNILAATALLMLSAQSRAIFTVGFQLSFLAVASIVYFQPKLVTLISIRQPVIQYFWQLFCLGIAAQLGTAVISIHYFHQFPVYFWLSGLVIVPLASVALLLGVAVLCLAEVPYLGQILISALDYLVTWMNYAMAYIGDLPQSTISGLQVSKPLCLGLLLLIVCCTLWLEFRHKLLAGLVFITLILIGLQVGSAQVKWRQQKQLLVYHHRSAFAVSLVQGQQAVHFYNQFKDTLAVAYAQSAYLQEMNIRQDSTVYLDGSSSLIHWSGYRVLVLQDVIDLCQYAVNQRVDLAILSPGFYSKEIELLKSLDIQAYYLHPALPSKTRIFWQKQLAEEKVLMDGSHFDQALFIDFK